MGLSLEDGEQQGLTVRIWDLTPGYLNRGSLLGEHRELHGLHSILVNSKKGYANHPETLRWVGALGDLVGRHNQLIAEMSPEGVRRPDAFGVGA